MAKPKPLEEPHKELRFTRAQQAQFFFILAAVFLSGGVLLLILKNHPDVRWWHSLICLLPTMICLKTAFFCTRHAYLILTPLGIEIFPFRHAEKNLEMRFWSEFTAADFDEELTKLTLHTNAEKTAGLVISLHPIIISQRPFLKKAILGRVAERK